MDHIDHNDLRNMAWDLGEWEQAYNIQVGTAYCCGKCGNLVMVTKGGVGVLQLSCCGEPMRKGGDCKGDGCDGEEGTRR